MKKTLLATAAIALLSGAAIAQPYDRGGPPPAAYHHWARGEHLPRQYWGKDHEVDWRHNHLRRPPAGYHWVHDDNNQFVLAGTRTGIVLDIH